MDLKPRKRNMVSEYFNGLAEKYGGTLETETQRIDADGQRTVERTVKHFPPPKPPKAGGQVARSRRRPRGAGRPKAATRSSARSGDSGDSDLSDEPEPPRRGLKLCEFCSGELPLGSVGTAQHFTPTVTGSGVSGTRTGRRTDSRPMSLPGS